MRSAFRPSPPRPHRLRAPGPKALGADQVLGCLHRQEQRLRMTHQRLKLVLRVEGSGVLVNSIGADRVGPNTIPFVIGEGF